MRSFFKASGVLVAAMVALVLAQESARAQPALADSKTYRTLAMINSGVEEAGFFPLDRAFRGNIPATGVDQVYLNYTLDKIILVMLGARPQHRGRSR